MFFSAWLKSWKAGLISQRRRSRTGRPAGIVGRLIAREWAESLEDRTLLSTITVNTVQDVLDGNTQGLDQLLASPGADGKISLREAILAANHGGTGSIELEQLDGELGTTITFDPALTATGDATITLTLFDVVDERQMSFTTNTIVSQMSEFGPTAFQIFSVIEIVGPTGDNGIRIERADGAADF